MKYEQRPETVSFFMSLTGQLVASLLVTVGNSIDRHLETLSTIKQSYQQLEQQSSVQQ
ncbi:hypothetical protein [Paenibacillus sp. JJ-100]|uniref:hypothetical protein n=1 Tax=Paenibacillus sp. JJ-100 TaxID=2974896 RepID=UPI00232EA3FB|nr:hypothetical protein [Paenibacillus sp. JJ-100]